MDESPYREPVPAGPHFLRVVARWLAAPIGIEGRALLGVCTAALLAFGIYVRGTYVQMFQDAWPPRYPGDRLTALLLLVPWVQIGVGILLLGATIGGWRTPRWMLLAWCLVACAIVTPMGVVWFLDSVGRDPRSLPPY